MSELADPEVKHHRAVARSARREAGRPAFIATVIMTVLDDPAMDGVGRRALERFVSQHGERLRDFDALLAFFACFPNDKEGNTDAAITLWGFRLGSRAEQLRGLAVHLAGEGVHDLASLRQWAASAEYVTHFKGRIKGLGSTAFRGLVTRAAATAG